MAELKEDASKKEFEILTIGIGQGGSRLSHTIAAKFNQVKNLVCVNTSKGDLESLEGVDKNRLIKLGNDDIEGSGKDRSTAKSFLAAMHGNVISQILTKVTEKHYDFIFIASSTGGGTGSGIGPALTTLLNSEEFSTKLVESTKNSEDFSHYEGNLPIIFGVVILPSLDEGNLALSNTLECLEDINKFIQKDFARFFITTNNAVNLKQCGDKRTVQYNTINEMVAESLNRFLNVYGYSRVATLDRADRLGALKVMGLHSLATIDADGNNGPTAFYLPQGERVKRILYEVPIDKEVQTTKLITSNGVFSDDVTGAYYEVDKSTDPKIRPIIAYHGFKNVAHIAEIYSNKLQQNKELAKKIEKDNNSFATGLDDVAGERQFRNNEYTGHKAVNFKDIFAL